MARGVKARLSRVRRRVCTGGSELSTVGTVAQRELAALLLQHTVASWPEAVSELDENTSGSRSTRSQSS